MLRCIVSDVEFLQQVPRCWAARFDEHSSMLMATALLSLFVSLFQQAGKDRGCQKEDCGKASNGYLFPHLHCKELRRHD